jgi:hypothetical protein
MGVPYSVQRLVYGLGDWEKVFRFQVGVEFFSLLQNMRIALTPTRPPTQQASAGLSRLKPIHIQSPRKLES